MVFKEFKVPIYEPVDLFYSVFVVSSFLFSKALVPWLTKEYPQEFQGLCFCVPSVGGSHFLVFIFLKFIIFYSWWLFKTHILHDSMSAG